MRLGSLAPAWRPAFADTFGSRWSIRQRQSGFGPFVADSFQLALHGPLDAIQLVSDLAGTEPLQSK
jgi:hypothetical protein